MRARGAVLEGIALVAVALLPVLADRMRADTPRCAQDGSPVESVYAVEVELEDGSRLSFCGVACADLWVKRSPATTRRVWVVDCVDGGKTDAGKAHYVRTRGGWAENAPDPIRVFASREEALSHVREFGGELLVGPRRPLRGVGELSAGLTRE